MPATFTGPQTTYVPNFEASGKLTVNFSRNPKSFALNSYVQLQPVKQMVGYYRKSTVEEQGRILNTDGADFAWPDNAEMPRGLSHESDQYLAYGCKRYAFREQLGDEATDQAEFQIFDEYEARLAQQAMTFRTLRAVTALTTTGNYETGHYSAVASISGNTGNWAASTSARQDIKRSLNYAANLILKDTLAGVDVNDFVLVMSPGCAASIAITQEIVDHVKGSPDALAQIRGELPGRNAIFGLPDKLYGFPVVIEKTVKVTSRKGATKASSYVLADSTPFLVSRPGGLVGVAGVPTFSTCVVFAYEKDGGDLKVMREHDNWNRFTKIAVVDNFDVKVVSGESGFLFTSAV